jgi:hypothetical protein
MDNPGASPHQLVTVLVGDLHRRSRVRRALDPEHVEQLAEVLDRCPPIVLSSDGALVDGEHRVAAARRLGLTALPAVVLPAPTAAGEDLIRALEANASHGLPLTRQERRDAVAAVLAVRPELSDRQTARICGVGRSVVAAVRAAHDCSGGSNGHVNDRLGRDSKRYGTAPDGWHALLEAWLRVEPTATVRELAALTGASVGAVHNRRRDLRSRIEAEHRLLRWWRKLRARWYLRRARRGPGTTLGAPSSPRSGCATSTRNTGHETALPGDGCSVQ